MHQQNEEKVKNKLPHRSYSKGQYKTYEGIFLIVLQIVVASIYGFFIEVQMVALNISTILRTILLAIMLVAGFALYYSYLFRLTFSSLHFCFLILALNIQLYPLVSAFWTKTNIYTSNNINQGTFSSQPIKLSLSLIPSIKERNTHVDIAGAVKCALSVIVGFGSIIGRTGSLEILIFTIIGIIGYQLNRNLSLIYGIDAFGTFTIFAFGGFMGLTSGILTLIREKQKSIYTQKMQVFLTNLYSQSMSQIGVIIIMITFPILSIQVVSMQTKFNFQPAISCFLSVGASIICMIAMILFFEGEQSIRPKLIMNSVIAGGIITGTASFYIDRPYKALIAGCVAGIIQYILNGIEKIIVRKYGIVTTYSSSLFCFQSFVGALFSLGYRSNVDKTENIKYQIIIYFISVGMGIATGLLSGIIIYIINNRPKELMFNDLYMFHNLDFIRYPNIPKQSKQSSQQMYQVEYIQEDYPQIFLAEMLQVI